MFWSLHAHGLERLRHRALPRRAAVRQARVAYTKVIVIGRRCRASCSARRCATSAGACGSTPPAVMIAGGLASAYVDRARLARDHQLRLRDVHGRGRLADDALDASTSSGAISATYLMTCWVGLYFGFTLLRVDADCSAKRRCAPRRSRRKRSSRCCAISSIRTSCSTR